MDIATIGGIVLALAAILGGQVLEGGHVGSIMQPTAAIIVFGGTIGAAAVQFTVPVLKQTVGKMKTVFIPVKHEVDGTIKKLVALANTARREGLVGIERDVAGIQDPFLKHALEMVVDGTDARTLRGALELEMTHEEEEGELPAKVLEAMGGYAPTVGILGAVLGLIHVMENLSDPGKLGSGIAVAFVATVYGVGMANLFLLPLSGKLKLRHKESMVMMEVVVEGACAIADGDVPRVVERKLAPYRHGHAAEGEGAPGGAGAAAQAT
jgi:chemotaxis protein MotA